MIRTEFYEGQGLGNQLWVYAAGRGIAEHLGRPHLVIGCKKFKGNGFLEIDWGGDPTPDIPVSQFYEALYYDPDLKYFSSIYDARVERLPPRAQVNGLLQSEQYFYGRIDALPQWIRPTNVVRDAMSRYRDIIVLNLRGGEYKRHKKLILPRNYWNMAIEVLQSKSSTSDILIVTDDPAYARAILPKYQVLLGSISECYAALMGARAIAVSNSSFAYFPIKTRHDHPFVVAPEHWARYGNPHQSWAMPSNLYSGWNWLSSSGKLKSYEDCLPDSQRDSLRYETEYYIRVPPKLGIGLSWSRYIPNKLKRPLKRIAGRLFPMRIG